MLKRFVRAALACAVGAAAPASACTGLVIIGEGAGRITTSIPNKPVGTKCINDLIVDTVAEGASYRNRGEFLATVSRLTERWLERGILDREQRRAIREAARASSVGATVTLRVIGFNDFHGNLESPGTLGRSLAVAPAQRRPVGGADYIAGHVANLKSANPLSVVVGAGDLIGASPLISGLFNDEPAVEVLNRIGLEFNAVGNHEFDHGSAELLRLQHGGCKPNDPNSCRGAQVGTPVPFEGAKFQWLSANVFSAATGRTLLPAYGIKRFGRWTIAFIGMTLKETPAIVTPTGVAGLEFRDEADTVNALVRRLRGKKVNAIVVLVHHGGFQTGSLQDINGCDGVLAGSPIASIVNRLSDRVDAVLSGHTHTAYNCLLPNAGGRKIPVTSANALGRVLTAIDLVIDTRTTRVTSIHSVNTLVARDDTTITPDAQVKAIMDAYGRLVSPLANTVIGSITTDLPHTAIDGACNAAAGDMVADAQLAATRQAGFGGAVISFVNPLAVRSPGFTFASSSAGEGDGNVTYAEAFTVRPFGNSLVTMTLTAQDIKDVLEEQFAGCRGQPAATTRIMSPSAGLSYTWDGSKACDARISDVKLERAGVTETIVDAAGVVRDPTKPYRVTVTSFMASGGDGFSTFARGTNLLGGAQDIDAQVAYMAKFKAPNAPYDPADPALGKPRIRRINAPLGSTACPDRTDTNP